jgi:predicted  nucleic acid-binding Zn-ribbon protein
MSASLGLYRLQQVDRQIDQARAQLEIIHKTLENDTELRDALAKMEEARNANHGARHELKNAEAETQSQKIKIEQAEASLYGGKVQNPKELQDLQKDVASLKKHLLTLEERELECMLKAETTENILSDANTQLEQIQARRGDEHKKLLDDQATYLKDLERLGEEREASVNPIESSLLAVYDNLRKQKHGVAVADFSDNACASCGSTLNAAVQQNAKSSKQLAYCPTCGRILYAS